MQDTQRVYLPAAGKDWALPFYDPLVKLLGADSARLELLEQANLRPGDRVLDIGCGTGTLVALIKRRYPPVEVVGIDPDPKALARAAKKIKKAGAAVQLDRGFADELPYADESFDRVVSSFMFHHLEAGNREKTLREVRRVLRPGGSLHLLDFASMEGRGHHGFGAHLHSRRMKDNSFADEPGWISGIRKAERGRRFLRSYSRRVLSGMAAGESFRLTAQPTEQPNPVAFLASNDRPEIVQDAQELAAFEP